MVFFLWPLFLSSGSVRLRGLAGRVVEDHGKAAGRLRGR